MVVCKIGERTLASSSEVEGSVLLTIKVDANFNWVLIVGGVNITSFCDAVKNISQPLRPENDITSVLSQLDGLSICPGHPDEHLVQMMKERKRSDHSSAYVDTGSNVFLCGKLYTETVRVSSCHMLVTSGKCPACTAYRPSLRKMYSRWKEKKRASPTKLVSTSSKTNIRYLRTPEQQKRVALMRSRIESAEQKVRRLKKKIENSVATRGISVGDDLHEDLTTIVQEQHPSICDQFKEGTFQRLLWDQQREAMMKSDPRQMRWHPTMVKWCLNIKLHSTRTYEALRRYIA